MSVYTKLQGVRVALQHLPIKKSGHNKFAGYTYFELGDFLPTITELFNSAGLCSVVSFTDELATLRVVDMDDGTEIVFTSPMRAAALKGCHDIQNLGAVETYQRRYLFVTALEIVEHDALDSSEPVKQGKPTLAPTASKSITASVFETMDASAQEAMKNAAMSVFEAFETSADTGFDEYQRVKSSYDADQQTAFWNLLDSKTRSSIKKTGEARK
jgi:hypothetical protein